MRRMRDESKDYGESRMRTKHNCHRINLDDYNSVYNNIGVYKSWGLID